MINSSGVSIEEFFARVKHSSYVASQLAGMEKVPGKKIIFQREGAGGKELLITPQAKQQPQGFFWFDITREQLCLMKTANKCLFYVRLGNGDVVNVESNWLIAAGLTENCVKCNDREGDHWQLYLYPVDRNQYRLRVVGGIDNHYVMICGF